MVIRELLSEVTLIYATELDAGEGFAPPMFLAYETGMLASLPAIMVDRRGLEPRFSTCKADVIPSILAAHGGDPGSRTPIKSLQSFRNPVIRDPLKLVGAGKEIRTLI